MPIVRVEAFEGRTLDQKRRLAKAITEAVSDIYETTHDAVTIVFTEMKREDLAHAGRLYTDKD